ncbi:MAG: PKD domain-containing protein [Arcticibacter sp.]
MFHRQVSKLVLVCIGILMPVFTKAQVGCPSVSAGPDVTVGCGNPCTNLTATWFDSGQTNNYLAIPITYAPNPYNVGTPILVNIDDTWSSVINLPFNFCFFGANYNQVVIGSNGIISFNTSYASGGCPWNLQGLPAGIPTTSLPTASIMGIYQDIDPTFLGDIYYQLTGVAPCRKLIVSFYQVPYYGDPNSVSTSSCPSPLFTTSQIVLYETTNAIDIFTQNKPVCSGWNSGLAIQGIQNMAGTQAVVVPGRNNTVFTTSNDAWRFLPFGASISSFAWLQGSTVISNSPVVNVCPSVTTTYTAQVTYTTCNGNSVVVTDNVTVTPNSTVQANAAIAQNVTCNNGNNGSATANLVAGQAPATYQWSPNAGSSNSQTVTGLSPGTYTVTVTDASGCSSINSVTIPNPPAITSANNITNVSCNGGSNGSVTTIPANGTGPYTYNWSPVAGNNATLGSLSAGTYSCTITDANGCTGSATATVTQPNAIASTVSSTNVSCNGGSNGTATVVSLGGGTAPFSYSWNTTPVQSISTATNLVAGTYAVTITDANGCTFTSSSTTITEPTATILNATPTATICGQSNGTITVTASGGTSPYSFNLNGGANQGSTFFNNLAAGSYTVNATDANGCTSSFNTSVGVLPTVNIQSSNSTPVSCFGGNNGTISIVATGGVAPLQYNLAGNPQQPTPSWSNLTAGNYTVIVTDANNCASTVAVTVTQPTLLNASASNIGTTCSNPNGSVSAIAGGGTAPYSYSINGGAAQTGASFTNLAAGLYNVLVTDANGCTANASTTIIDQPGPAISSSPTTNVSCFGGSNGTITVNTNLGTTPLSFSLNSGSGQSNNNFNGLSQGNYSILVTDANGCTASNSVTITEPTLLSSTASLIQHSCNPIPNGSAQVTPVGGTAPYGYSWSPAGGGSSVANGLTGGTYTILVTDGNGCTSTSNVVVLQSNLNIVLTPDSVTCFGGSDGGITSVVTGNTGPISYSWNPTSQNTPDINNLAQGSYTLTVVDSINCTTNATVSVGQPLPPAVQLSANPAGICYGKTTLITAGGGVTYQWSNGASTDQITVSPITGTTYTVTITNASGCTNSSDISIPVYPLPVVSFVADTICAGQSTSFTNTSSVPSGIIASYQWNFSNGSSSNSMNPASTFIAGVGSAQLIATTDQGCVDSITSPIRVWNLPVPDFVADTTAGCPPVNVNFTDLSTSIDGSVTSWQWNSGNGNASTINSLTSNYPTAGFYDVGLQVTSSYGCVSDTLFANYIQVYDQPIANFSTMPVQPSVYVPNVQFLDESFAAATWFWDFGDAGFSNLQNPYHTYVFPGTYNVMLAIESSEGCVDTAIKEVIVLDEVALWIPNSFTPNNDGLNDIFYAYGNNITDFSMKIFNRWGDLVFVTDDPANGWNGKIDDAEALQDVYVYTASFKTIKNTTEVKTGRLSLVR